MRELYVTATSNARRRFPPDRFRCAAYRDHDAVARFVFRPPGCRVAARACDGAVAHGFPRCARARTAAAAGWSFQQLVKRRLQGEPIAYIRGQQEFWSLLFEVTPAVLIPRPETELVVERALTHLDTDQLLHGLRTSAPAAARSHLRWRSERPAAHVVATDASKEALEIATRNAARLQIANVTLVQGSWFAPLGGRALRHDRLESALYRGRRS